MAATIFVKDRFLGTHRWPGAKGEIAFLANEHHHDFHVTVSTKVTDLDRQIEFIQLRLALRKIVAYLWPVEGGIIRFGTLSCEMIGLRIQEQLMEMFPDNTFDVCVSEDDTQGASTWSSS